MKMRFFLPLLLLVFTSNIIAADAPLSLEEATRIAKERIKKDGLPVDHLVIQLVDMPQSKDKSYAVWFDPQIPDPKKERAFIGYNVKMDGVVEKAVITETRTTVRALTRFGGVPNIVFDTRKAAASDLLDNPYSLRLDTGKPKCGINP